MNYKHITIEERICIQQLKISGLSIRKIAQSIKRSPSTVSRELKRNSYNTGKAGCTTRYVATNANEKYHVRRLNSHRQCTATTELINYIQSKIELHWSPEQISNRVTDDISKIPCHSTIYRWIKNGTLDKITYKQLRRKGKFKRPAETRGKFNIGKTIKKRPKSVYKRNELGHWEADTVVSGKYDNKLKSSYCFVTLVERKSRYCIAKQIPNRKAETVTKAIIELLSDLPDDLVLSITCDRGKEFSMYNEVEEKLKCDVYFADPYCSWQRGTNENTNGLLREFYPKGMDLSLTNNIDL